jgi:ribosomal protein S12 methylthiotransferase accessory factor
MIGSGEASRAFFEPASRYRSPLSFKEKLFLRLESEIVSRSFVAKRGVVAIPESFPFPLRWKKIFDYLRSAGVTRVAYPTFDRMFTDEPKPYGLRLWASDLSGKTDGWTSLLDGGYSRGVSFDFEEAISKVVGELLERYPLALYREKDLLRCSVNRLRTEKKRFFDPFLASQFSEEQKKRFPAYRFDEKSVFGWARGESLTTGKEAFIPAQVTFWNYRLAEGEPILKQRNTSGSGGMFTREEAILSGLYELIQRDGFLVHWLNRIAPPHIDPASFRSEKVRELFAVCNRYGIEAHVVDITSDIGVPAMAAVLIDTYGKGPAVTVGGGCGPDPEQAAERAMAEALGVRYWLRNAMEQSVYDLPEGYEPFFTGGLDQKTRLIYWGNPGMEKEIRFFLSGKSLSIQDVPVYEWQGNKGPKGELDSLLKLFSGRGDGYEVFCYEAKDTVLDVLGYASVSVSVPALLPLYLDETKAPLGKPRIREAAIAMGYESSASINPIPHPFP